MCSWLPHRILVPIMRVYTYSLGSQYLVWHGDMLANRQNFLFYCWSIESQREKNHFFEIDLYFSISKIIFFIWFIFSFCWIFILDLQNISFDRFSKLEAWLICLAISTENYIFCHGIDLDCSCKQTCLVFAHRISQYIYIGL